MYLAVERKNQLPSYLLRTSWRTDRGQIGPRTVFDLGPFPAMHFEMLEEHVVIFSQKLLSAVEPFLGKKSEEILENLLWFFLPESARDRLGRFRGRGNSRHLSPLSQEEKDAIRKEIHPFDQRRLYYIRYGAVDQSRICTMHEKCARPLLGMCRDEKEFWFMEQEFSLKPGQYMQYVFAIFDLQRHFNQSFARWLPEALAYEEMAEHLEKAICHLQQDAGFWMGEEYSPQSLHHHLVRYLLMFFDYQPAPRNFAAEYGTQFRDRHRIFRWPEKKTASEETVLKLFGKSRSTLRKMGKRDFTRLFRKKAMELHPDRGGDHETFIKLTEIYQEITKFQNPH